MEVLRLPGVDLGGESSLPPIANVNNVQQQTASALGEEEGLFIGFGHIPNGFPYRQQDLYERELTEKELTVAVLENPHLKAIFAPTLGGRLLSLYDKDEGRELLFRNPVFRTGNLAVRNAWFSGGVEWNMGVVGHGPYTASPLFTARLQLPDGTPVLRIYGYERIRRATWQMDFFLPEDARLLYCRMRVVNPRTETIPMYWWSNIAVPELPDGRVITSSSDAYTYLDGKIQKVPIPAYGGVDVTYPVHNRKAVDHFFRVPDEKPKYITQVDARGDGFLQTSTSRLKGRKLFVWGQGRGGDRWQEFLSDESEHGGRYIELQAGLGRTQYESLPMPPQTAWEWLEAYGSIKADPARIHGEWVQAVAEAEARVEEKAPRAELERLLAETKEMALRPADELLISGDGWGALESLRRELEGEAPLSRHLDFGTPGPEQAHWKRLLEEGRLGEADPEQAPISWMEEDAFASRLAKAVEGEERYNWYAWLHHGMICLQKRRFDEARAALERSVELQRNAWALYGLSILAETLGYPKQAGTLARDASLLLPGDLSLAKEAMRRLCTAGLYDETLRLEAQYAPSIQANGRVKFYKACALAYTGKLDEAEELLCGNGGLIINDMREGEITMTDLWSYIREQRIKRGEPVSPDENPPHVLDFRMFV